MGGGTLWLWCSAVVLRFGGLWGCNVRELGEMVQRRFREEVAAQCGSVGDKCSFDRECCKGLECSMSASKGGVGLSCQRAWLKDPDRGDMQWEAPEESQREPQSEDVDWMVIKSEEAKDTGEELRGSTDDNSEKMYPTDMLSEIENLQEKKKLKLLRENYELEKLFTEREEKELEKLRALREDAELDELRKLKELRLKRKLQLIKELKELRGLRAEKELNTLDEFKKQANASKHEEYTSIYNQTDGLGYNLSGNHNPSTTSTDRGESLEEAAEPREGGGAPAKHKQGIHEVRHKKKHHHHKKKDSTGQPETVAPGKEENATEYNAG